MLLWSLLAGCGGEPCDPEVDLDTRCEGDSVVSCPEPGVDQLIGANRWVARACPDDQVCVEAAPGFAFCALDDTPDPACTNRGTTCADGGTQLFCWSGYVTGSQACLSCTDEPDGSTCEGGFGATCGSDADCVSGECSPDGLCL